MGDKLIYLASPLTHEDSEVVREREFEVLSAAAGMIKEGKAVFSPVVYTYYIAGTHYLPMQWDYWKRLDLLMLSRCDEMAILKLDGWEDSIGIKEEMEEARKLSIPITYIDKEKYAYEYNHYSG